MPVHFALMMRAPRPFARAPLDQVALQSYFAIDPSRRGMLCNGAGTLLSHDLPTTNCRYYRTRIEPLRRRLFAGSLHPNDNNTRIRVDESCAVVKHLII